jgi:periplasmic protein TonB
MNRVNILLILISMLIVGCTKDYRMIPYQPPADREGSAVDQVNEPIIPLYSKAPNFPRISLVEQLCGWVKVGYFIGKDGKSKQVRVIDSSPKGVFEKQAIEAIKSWKWEIKESWDEAFYKKQRNYMVEFNMHGCTNKQ